MINEIHANAYCKDDISKIENYELAIDDKERTWQCHHRLVLTLDGEFAHTMDELKRLNMYYHRPAFELIFLTQTEHNKIHKRSEETKKKMSESAKCAYKEKYGANKRVPWNKGLHIKELKK